MANSDYVEQGQGPFAPTAVLSEAIGYLATEIKINDLNMPYEGALRIGMGAMIDDEIIRVDAIGPDKLKIARGCADTVPAQHARATVIWFFDGYLGTSGKEFAGGEDVSTKIMPRTSADRYPIEWAPPVHTQLNWRFWRPYAPGKLRTNDTPWFNSKQINAANGYLRLTWAHRHRTLQQDQLYDHTLDDIGPEPGSTYRVDVFDKWGARVRRETGIATNAWNYTWQQAIYDLGMQTELTGVVTEGYMELYTVRDGFESWQGYKIPFTVDNTGEFVYGASAQTVAALQDDSFNVKSNLMKATVFSAQAMSVAAVQDEGLAQQSLQGVFATAMTESVAQLASVNPVMSRSSFESPFAWNIRRGVGGGGNHAVTVTARPADRLTDGHSIYTGDKTSEYTNVAYGLRDHPGFTPWVVTNIPLMPLDTRVTFTQTSLHDGISLSSVRPGQMAMLGAEIVRISSVRESEGVVEFSRGCVDTVPTTHASNVRMWFFEAASGFDSTSWTNDVIALGIKVVGDTYGTPVELDTVTMDTLPLQGRSDRPYVMGNLQVDGAPWYEGGAQSGNKAMRFTWNERNRITQGDTILDHHAPHVPPEGGVEYNINLTVYYNVNNRDGTTTRHSVVVRNDLVSGDNWLYTKEMMDADALRVASVIGSTNGKVYVNLWIYAQRDGKKSWQGYQVRVSLNVPYGTGGGGGIQTGGGEQGGNGETGKDDEAEADPSDPSEPPDDGSGVPPPIDPPTNWPDEPEPVEPEQPDTGASDPSWQGHWDTYWDQYYDAGKGDDLGED